MALSEEQREIVEDLIDVVLDMLADDAEKVVVRLTDGGRNTIVEILPNTAEETGAIVGRKGRVVNAMKAILDAYGRRVHHSFHLTVLGVEKKERTPR